MIRKVPNIRAWVLKKEDLPILFKTNTNLIDACRFLKTIYCLPILSNTPWYYNPLFDDYLSDIILVTIETPYQVNLCLFNEDRTMKMEYIEEINRIWNSFYEENTRKQKCNLH